MIKNRSELLSHGFIKGREKALDIAEHALQHVDPFAAVKRYVNLDGNMLQANEDVFNLNNVNKIYAIGAGKATYPIARALVSIRLWKKYQKTGGSFLIRMWWMPV